METPEFIDTYSDDILNLVEAHRAFLTHPLLNSWPDNANATFCRILAVFMVGTIEGAIEYWKELDKFGILRKYFDGGSNSDRLESLKQAFLQSGISVDDGLLNDYLAIKYMRNAIVHSGWNEQQRQWVIARGFPADARQLTEQHWIKMLTVNENMQFVLALPALLASAGLSAVALKSRRRPVTPIPAHVKPIDWLPVYSQTEWAGMAWKTIEAVSTKLSKDIRPFQESQFIKRYWTHEDGDGDVGLYRAIKRGIQLEDGTEETWKQLAASGALAWKIFKDVSDLQSIPVEHCVQATEVLDGLARRDIYPVIPVPTLKTMPHAEARQFVQHSFKNDNKEGVDSSEVDLIIDSFNLGARVYGIIKNSSAADLFCIWIPAMVPAQVNVQNVTGRYVLAITRLRHVWYAYVEHKKTCNPLPLRTHELFLDCA
jgi:hypothetical protein